MIGPVCKNCETQIVKPKTAEQFQNIHHSKISLGFLYHIALDLHFSFQSISLLIDFIRNRSARKLNIRLSKIIDIQNIQIPDQHYDENYVQLKFSGNQLTKIQAQQIANSCYSKVKGGMDLILGMFGIGKTGVLVSNNGVQKSVIVFSVDDRINSNYFKQQCGLLYIENIVTKNIENINGNIMKRIINQGLKIYHPHPQVALQCGQNQSKILIFHPKIFVSSNKLMFYEIRQSNLGHDIDTHYNPQKIQFLNKMGYQMSIHSQFRLSCYLTCLYLQQIFPIRIGDSQQAICKTTYAQYLETLRQNGVLNKINQCKINGAVKVDLYETNEKYFIENNGILLYWKGRMINRFDVQFGRMIEQKFYKKKYRSPPTNIWAVAGIIQLDGNKFTPNSVKNKFINSFQFRRFVKDVLTILENTKSKSNVIVIQNQGSNQKHRKQSSSDNYVFPQPRKRVKKQKEDKQKQKDKEKQKERQNQEEKERQNQEEKERQNQEEKEKDKQKEEENYKQKEKDNKKIGISIQIKDDDQEEEGQKIQ